MDWLERLFGFVPDGGDGSFEAVIMIVVGGLALRIFHVVRHVGRDHLQILAALPPLAARRLVGDLCRTYMRMHRPFWRSPLEGWLLEIVWWASLGGHGMTVEEVARESGLPQRSVQRQLAKMATASGQLERVKRNGVYRYRVKREWLEKAVAGEPSCYDEIVEKIHTTSDALPRKVAHPKK